MIETLITLAYLCAFELQEELESIETSKQTKLAKKVCDNVVGAMYYEYKDLMNTPNNIIYTQANTLKNCLSNTLELHSFPSDPVLQNKMRCIMLSNLICSCANLVPQEVGSVQHFKNRAVVVENLSRFKHRFAGQGIAMEKLESFAFCEVQKIRSEDQIKQIVIDFVTEINKSL